jgi:predicted esterase
MSKIQEFIDKCEFDFPKKNKYKVYKFEESILNEKFGFIKVLSIILDKKDGIPLVIVPGYSFKSFCTMIKIIFDGFDHIKDLYSHIYMLVWSDEVKEQSEKILEGVTDKKLQYEINENYRIKLASILDKILKSPDMNLKKFDLMGKSAGGGVVTFVATMNDNINRLILISPGTNSEGKNLKKFKKKILLAWNQDDNKIPYQTHQNYITNFENNGNDYDFYTFKSGGHELNIKFLKELQSNKIDDKQKFINSIDENKLNKLLTKKNKILIRHEMEDDTLFFTIKGDNITYRYVIEELTRQGLNLVDNDPDHIFIEDFRLYDDYTFDIVIGS